jgi:adenosine deaminase
MMALAARHGVALPYDSVEAVRAAYDFADLQSFLDLYYLGASVLRDEDDFYRLMRAYLERCREERIVHAEIMLDPQTHTARGVGFDVFMPGFLRAMDDARAEWGQSSLLILSVLRDQSEQSALETLRQAEPWLERLMAVGLDSAEVGHPPEQFRRAFAAARAKGLRAVAHAGEEGPPAYIRGALDALGAERIDHGVRCLEDPALTDELARRQVPLTVCPLSNVKLRVFDSMADHNVLELLERGLLVTVNADDPSYFGGYLCDNFRALEADLGMTREQLIRLVRNGFTASFLPEAEKRRWIAVVDAAAA